MELKFIILVDVVCYGLKNNYMIISDIENIDALDIQAKYRINNINVFFDAKTWEWRAVNSFGFGIDSDLSVVLLLKRLINETRKS